MQENWACFKLLQNDDRKKPILTLESPRSSLKVKCVVRTVFLSDHFKTQ